MVTKLNCLFEKFLIYEPDFCRNGGKVSVIGHSLGSVLTYDVVTRWSPLVDYDALLTRRMVLAQTRSTIAIIIESKHVFRTR